MVKLAGRLGRLLALIACLWAGGVQAQQKGAVGTLGVAPGKLNLTATYHSIGVEWLFTGDDNGNATATLEFRRAGDANWRNGLPLWLTGSDIGAGPAFYGSALKLDAG